MYSAIQLIGIIRSVPKRPLTINDNELILRFGMLSETIIPIEAIDTIALADSSDFDKEKTTKTLSLAWRIRKQQCCYSIKNTSAITVYLRKTQKTIPNYYFC